MFKLVLSYIFIMKNRKPYSINSIAELNKILSLPEPEHPLITAVNMEEIKSVLDKNVTGMIFNFYSIWVQKNADRKIRYGQGYFGFDKGEMIFIAPGQLVSTRDHMITGCVGLAFHPSFIQGHALEKKIKEYDYFSYAVNDALYLSRKEEAMVMSIMGHIVQEYRSVDKYTQEVIISHIELLLNYANRFYGRQFMIKKNINNHMLAKIEEELNSYFKGSRLQMGLPTVKFLAEELHVTAGYLSDMLRELTGQNAQQHIQNKLLEKAKELLSSTALSTSEIAYQLGFGHPQSFSRLFKQKNNISPTEFRNIFLN